jgi:hypothetical protein
MSAESKTIHIELSGWLGMFASGRRLESALRRWYRGSVAERGKEK